MAAFESQVEKAYLMGSIGAIQSVLQGLRDLPGRKSLILFSESMQRSFLEGGLINTPGIGQSVDDRLKRLTDAANRSSVVINSIDPRGLIFAGPAAQDNTQGASPAQISQIAGARAQQLIASEDGMAALAEKTGGVFVHNNNDVADALRAVVADGDGYYLIGYQPEGSTFDESERGGKFHNIRRIGKSHGPAGHPRG